MWAVPRLRVLGYGDGSEKTKPLSDKISYLSALVSLRPVIMLRGTDPVRQREKERGQEEGTVRGVPELTSDYVLEE